VTLEGLLERWNALERRVKIGILTAAIGLAAAAALTAFFSRDTRVPLFATALKADQLAEVDAQLSAWNVAFVPVHDNVRVDARMRGRLLARLAMAGVPHAHVMGTSEALAAVGTLTPQAILDAQARAGLEGDLEKGLRGIGGIEDARVIIAPARGGIFADESPTPATASVRLTAAPGNVLTASTLGAVRAFVAAGVPGLDAAHVTVVDDRGALEDDRGDDGRRRESALQSALDAAFGIGTTIVRVHVDRDSAARESRDVRRRPDAAAISHNDLEERFSGEKKSYTRRRTSLDRGSDVHEERKQIAAGSVARVSIAVIVDARRSFDLEKIRQVAAAASGLDPHRGDTLSVEAVAFDRPSGAAPQPFAYALGVFGEAIPAIALALVAIVALRVCAQPMTALAGDLMRRYALRRAAPQMQALGADAVFRALQDEPAHVAAAIVATLGTPLATAVLELYPPAERRAIVERLGRKRSPLVADLGAESIVHGR